MKGAPDVAKIASLLGEGARVNVLTALAGDRALTATELSAIAGVTKQTMSAHLSKLLDARLVAVDAQGRHRYFRLAHADVAQLMESLRGVAFRSGAVCSQAESAHPALRKSRICYDHLAGEVGVEVFTRLCEGNVFARGPEGLQLTTKGTEWFARFGVDTTALAIRRRTLCRACMDWSERSEHLAGALGCALLARVCDLGWAKRERSTRVIRFSARGEHELLELTRAAAASPGGERA
jgi:DNA-binding transcriptional ArsR family regulator